MKKAIGGPLQAEDSCFISILTAFYTLMLGVTRVYFGAVTGESFSANCSIPTTSGPSSFIHVP